MNNLTKVLILKKKLKLIDLNFIGNGRASESHEWNEYPYSKEQYLIQGEVYPKIDNDTHDSIDHEWEWQHMRYMIATPTDVRDQCRCSAEYDGNCKLKPIIVGDLIVRNGKSVNFNSYHVPCAIELIKEMSDKLLQTIERNKLLHPILFEQEWGKDVRGMTRQ